MQCPDEDRVRRCLWPPPGTERARTGGGEVFAVLDLARDPRVQPAVLATAPHFACVEPGRLTAEQQAAAPYAVRLSPHGSMLDPWLREGWGESWGVLAVARERLSLEAFRRHCHALLRVRMPDDEVMIFRFYDPRVLRVFLPTCSAPQLSELFGPLETIWMESEGGDALLRFRVRGGRLERTVCALDAPEAADGAVELLPEVLPV